MRSWALFFSNTSALWLLSIAEVQSKQDSTTRFFYSLSSCEFVGSPTLSGARGDVMHQLQAPCTKETIGGRRHKNATKLLRFHRTYFAPPLRAADTRLSYPVDGPCSLQSFASSIASAIISIDASESALSTSLGVGLRAITGRKALTHSAVVIDDVCI